MVNLRRSRRSLYNFRPRVPIRKPAHKTKPRPTVGARVDVWWDDRAAAFRGTLSRFRPATRLFFVRYDDGDNVWHNLDHIVWRFAPAPAGRISTVPGSVSAVAAPTTPEWFQPGDLADMHSDFADNSMVARRVRRPSRASSAVPAGAAGEPASTSSAPESDQHEEDSGRDSPGPQDAAEPAGEEDPCGICLSEKTEPILLGPCGHTLCKPCLSHFLRYEFKKRQGNRNLLCPYCRHELRVEQRGRLMVLKRDSKRVHLRA